jgi:hypothetical protein
MKLIKILAGIIVFAAVPYAAALFGTRNAVADTEAFLTAGFEQRFEDAYNSMSAAAQNSTSAPQLAYLFYRHNLTGPSTISWSSRTVSNDQGLLEGTITNAAGEQSKLQINLVHSGEHWQVNGIAPASHAPPLELPEFNAGGNLVHESMMAFVDALDRGDFSDFRDRSAKTWQLQTTTESLNQSFSGMFEASDTIAGVMESGTASLEPPSIDPQGLMTIRGAYGDPAQLLFQQIYLKENGDWKMFGISVQPTPPAAVDEPMGSEEAASDTADG